MHEAGPQTDAWEAQAKQATSVIAMIGAMIGEMFGPIANIESEEATLLRGPEARHRGEAILEALGRVRDAINAAPSSIQEPPKMDEIDSKALAQKIVNDYLAEYERLRDESSNTHLWSLAEENLVSAITSKLDALEDENKTLREVLRRIKSLPFPIRHASIVVGYYYLARDIASAALSKPAALPAEGKGENSELRHKLWEALRFAASRSVISSADEKAILASYATPPAPQPLEGAVKVKDIAYAISRSYGENPEDDAPINKFCGPNNEPLPNWMAYEEQAEAVLSSLSPAPQPVGEVRAIYRHRNGSKYELLGIGKMQSGDWAQIGRFSCNAQRYDFDMIDMREVVIYRSVTDGHLWVRPREEFEDGRFELLSASPSPAAQEDGE